MARVRVVAWSKSRLWGRLDQPLDEAAEPVMSSEGDVWVCGGCGEWSSGCGLLQGTMGRWALKGLRSRLRAWWVTRAPVGYAVTPRIRARRVACSTAKNT